MNNINKQFRRLLRNDQKLLDNKMNKLYEAFEKAKIDKLTPARYNEIKSKPQILINRYNSLVESSKSSWYREFYKMHKEEIEELRILSRIVSFYKLKKDQCFIDFDFLEDYMEKKNLSTTEQGTILAYFMNFNILYFKNYRYSGNEEEVENIITELIDEKYGKKKNKKQRKLEVEKEIKDFDYNQEVCYQRYKELRIIIDEQGNIIPILEALTFFETEKILREDLTQNQAMKILYASSALAQEFKRAEFEKEMKNINRLNDRVALKQENVISEKRNKEEINRERRAKVELKKYLKDDKPICYIDDIANIINLLNQAGYLQNQINEIRRTILHFNKNHLELKQKQLFENAKHRYLSIEEISLLSITETIITNPDAIKNPIYFEIEHTFNDIKDRLISFIEVPDEEDLSLNYEAEYMVICLKELSDLLAAYRNSNYKLVLEKNSN